MSQMGMARVPFVQYLQPSAGGELLAQKWWWSLSIGTNIFWNLKQIYFNFGTNIFWNLKQIHFNFGTNTFLQTKFTTISRRRELLAQKWWGSLSIGTNIFSNLKQIHFNFETNTFLQYLQPSAGIELLAQKWCWPLFHLKSFQQFILSCFGEKSFPKSLK